MSRRNVLLAFAIGAIGALVGGSAVVWADHQFSDVPTGHAFHEQIGNVVDSHCASGFNDGTFRPGTSPTRGQFAYWLNNCGGRAEVATAHESFLDDAVDVHTGLAPVTISSNGDAEGSGLIVVIGTGTTGSSADGSVTWTLQGERGVFTDVLDETIDSIYAPPGATVNPSSTATLMGSWILEDAESVEFTIGVERNDGIPLANIDVVLTAMYFPFAGDGDAVPPPP